MKNQNISFNDIPTALESIINTQKEILKSLEKQPEKPEGKEILSITEASEFLGVNRSTLWKWEKDKKVKSYGIEGRRFFKRSELIDSLVPLNH